MPEKKKQRGNISGGTKSSQEMAHASSSVGGVVIGTRAEAARAHQRAKQLAMRECQAEERPTVLLSSGELKQVTRQLTHHGKKKIGGLYLPDGKRLEQKHNSAEDKLHDWEGAKKMTDEAQKAHDLGVVARTKASQDSMLHRRAQKAGQFDEELEDDEIKQKATRMLAECTEHERLEYNELFRRFDVDKDRTWGSIEIAQCFTDMGFATTVEEAANLLYFAGVRDVDRVTYHDFVLLMPKLKAYRVVLERDARAAFEKRDKDQDGFLNRNEVRDVLWLIAGPGGTDQEQVEIIVKKADREKTGKVSYDFFIRAFLGTPPVLSYTGGRRRTGILARLCCGGASQKQQQVVVDDEDSDED